MLLLKDIEKLFEDIDPESGTVKGAQVISRYLNELQGCFADQSAYRRALEKGNPLHYRLSVVEPAGGYGQLHYSVGMLTPGRIGREYHMTKGHLHSWRSAAEIYIGLRGDGCALLEDETDGHSELVPVHPLRCVYVPGHTMHRMINTEDEPLVYLSIFPAAAGRDYGTVVHRQFRHVVAEQGGRPTLLERTEYLSTLGAEEVVGA